MKKDTKQQKKSRKLNTIHNKIILAIVSITLASLLLVSLVVSWKVSQQTENDFRQSVNVQLHNIDANIDAFFAEVASNSTMLTNLSLLKETDGRITTYIDQTGVDGKLPMKPLEGDPFEAEVYNTFKTYVESHPHILATAIGVEENGGFVQYPENPRDAGYDARQRSWYELATANKDRVNFSDAYTTSSGQLVIYAAKAIVDDANNQRGVLSIDIDLTSLTDVMKANTIGETGYIVLTDRAGNIIAHPQDEQLQFENVSTLGISELENVENLPDAPFTTTIDGKKYIASVTPSSNADLGLNYIVFVEEREFTKSANEIMLFLLVTAILVIIASVVIASIVSRKIAKPIKVASAQLKRVGNGDFTHAIPDVYLEQQDEVGDIMRATNNMQMNLSELIASISDASKEVAGSSNELMETSSQSVIATNEVSRAIEEISLASKRLAKLAHEMQENINQFKY